MLYSRPFNSVIHSRIPLSPLHTSQVISRRCCTARKGTCLCCRSLVARTKERTLLLIPLCPKGICSPRLCCCCCWIMLVAAAATAEARSSWLNKCSARLREPTVNPLITLGRRRASQRVYLCVWHQRQPRACACGTSASSRSLGYNMPQRKPHCNATERGGKRQDEAIFRDGGGKNTTGLLACALLLLLRGGNITNKFLASSKG